MQFLEGLIYDKKEIMVGAHQLDLDDGDNSGYFGVWILAGNHFA